jgi:hypothetical protein
VRVSPLSGYVRVTTAIVPKAGTLVADITMAMFAQGNLKVLAWVYVITVILASALFG